MQDGEEGKAILQRISRLLEKADGMSEELRESVFKKAVKEYSKSFDRINLADKKTVKEE